MNQPLRIKKSKQGLYAIKVQGQSGFANRINSHTPDLQSHTPKRMSLKKQKTPVKHSVNEKQQENNKKLSTKQKSFNKSYYYDEQTPCSTRTKDTQTTPQQSCKQCEIHEKQCKQLSQALKKYEKDHIELKMNLTDLKENYEKNLKKYKMKCKIQKDELKLLKWILSQRKEFHAILQQLEEMKQTGVRPFDCDFFKEKENLDRNTCATDRSLPQRQRQPEKQGNYDTRIELQKEQIKKPQPKVILLNSQQLETPKTPTQKEIQMFKHINILEQKVMQLTVKNDFLERLKIKESNQTNSNSRNLNKRVHLNNDAEPISFTKKDFMAHCSNNIIVHAQQKRSCTNRYANLQRNSYRYSDDDEQYDELNFNKQLFQGRSSISDSLFNSLQSRQKVEVESRYESSLKQGTNDHNNRKIVHKDFHKKEQKTIYDLIVPESRSRYYDSIQQRSRLLGL